MKTVGIFEAKTTFSALIVEVESGESVTITKNGKAVARIVPIDSEQPRPFGVARELFEAGQIVVSDDFDAPLSPEILTTFYAKS